MSFLSALRESAAPAVAVEIASGRVSAASASNGVADSRCPRPMPSEPLPEGALVPSLTAVNAVDPGAVNGALSRLLEKMGRPRRIGLILPDVVAKVSIVRFEQVPAKDAGSRSAGALAGAEARCRSRSRRHRSATRRGIHAADGHEFVVTLARRSVIEEYEAVVQCRGRRARRRR